MTLRIFHMCDRCGRVLTRKMTSRDAIALVKGKNLNELCRKCREKISNFRAANRPKKRT